MIVDASALLLLALPPATGPFDRARLAAALARVAGVEALESPALAAYELGHVIHRKRRDASGPDRAARAATLRRLVGLAEQRTLDAALLGAAGEFAERAGVSFYDASYLAQARAANGSLMTADRGLAAHARSLGIRAYLLPDDLGRLDADYADEDAEALP